MTNMRSERSNTIILLLAALVFGLMSCQSTSSQENQSTSGEPSISLRETEQPTTISSILDNATVTLPTETPLPNHTPTAKSTTISSPTAVLLPTTTSTNPPTPTASVVPCKNTERLPSKAFPSEIDMNGSHNQRVAISYPFLFLAVEQYIGVFNIANPATPQFLGFWDFPDWPDISALQVYNEVAYFVSGSTLVTVNLSLQCRFEKIATIDIPFKIFRLQIEDDRLFVGGVSDTNERIITIYSIETPQQMNELGSVYLGNVPFTWSVTENIIYALGGELILVNVSDPALPQTKSVNLTLDSEQLSYSPSLWKEDRLYLLWEGDTLTIFSHLQDTSPVMVQNSERQLILGNLDYFAFQVSDDYIFLGGYTCEGSCGSYVTIFDSVNGEKLSGLGIPEHQSPIHSYYEIESNIIYAFSDDSLLVIDITNQDEPVIIDEIKLIT